MAVSAEAHRGYQVSPAVVLVASLAVLLFASVLPQFLGPATGHDQISYLIEARRMLAGARPYGPQLSETNPPLIIWFSAIPVLLARWTHLTEVASLKVLTTLLIVGSVAWSVRLVRRGPFARNRIASLLVGGVVLLAEFALLPEDYAQREHLLIILLIPYLLAVGTGVAEELSTGENVLLGLAAALGVWFKPYDVVVPVAVQLLFCVRQRSLRPLLSRAFISLVLGCCGILVAALLLAPGYFKEVIPLLGDTYWAIGGYSALAVFKHMWLYPLLVLVALWLWSRVKGRLTDPRTSFTLLVASVVASLACDLQHAIWRYHRYPHEALLVLAVGYALVDANRQRLEAQSPSAGLHAAPKNWSYVILPLALCVAGFSTWVMLKKARHIDHSATDAFMSQLPPGTTIYVFSTEVPAMGDSYRHHLTWASRFAHLWMLPAIIQNKAAVPAPHTPFKRLSPERIAQISTVQRTDTAQDLNRWQPSVVLVPVCEPSDACMSVPMKRFDILSWFLQGSDFASAWSHYQKQPGKVDDYDVYRRVF